MQNLLKCFEYLKPYHIDMLDAIAVMMELFTLQSKTPESITTILKLDKPKASAMLLQKLREIIEPELFIEPNPKINPRKILKLLASTPISHSIIEQFLHTITQKKTTNKLYFYSTPYEINQLLVGILDIQAGESIYNPCYGMGSVFLSLSHIAPHITLYGEELDPKLSLIARLIANLSKLDSSNLYVNDILASPIFRQGTGYKKFDKILCNPPLNAHLGTELLKDDERFSTAGNLIKTYPELVFLLHSLAHLGQKGVFIVRNQTLMKSSLEKRLRDKLCEDEMIEAIIELPKNIFPHQSYDFSLLVISSSNKQILHIDASSEHFYTKDGKYNRLINTQEILQLYRTKDKSPYSSLTPIASINPQDLRAHSYVKDSHARVKATPVKSTAQSLETLGVEIFRGQRIYGTQKDEEIEFFDIGIADFAPCGYTESFQTKKQLGNKSKIHKYQVRSYDILLSLRGITPKLTILGDITHTSVVNAGIIVLRAPSKAIAQGLYCYLFSQSGEQALAHLYKTSADGTISTENLAKLPIPSTYLRNTKDTLQKLNALRDQLYATHAQIHAIKARPYAKS
ncbi:N-6 DNA methylase [Helicobacter zhangjianzhongii]|uniref:N-6 DNA methylase n=1 Tax=Helicobacter zhangjianzhongii TaxID=2974574 RepID=A0ACC6FTU9_9HELI|nr:MULTISPECIES: N-6 DNA methylase [unclassified Helicobacter]MDL0080747.1 N-6 DNA methylase [Helicobacter sp. CPD2-1]MDL0082728.1 N-6 DNA methylase [Helicobacter sp. XJK30-2]